MFADRLGIRLALLVGDTVPLPAPYAAVTALSRVEVQSAAAGDDGFQLTFRLSRDAVADYGLLLSRTLEPFRRVVIGVVFGALPEMLVDGVITQQTVTPAEQPGSATLVATGRSLKQVMDLEEKNDQYPNQPDSVIATRVIAQYARYGILPAATPTPDVPLFIQRIPRQAETDLQFLQRLAARNGYVFYLEPVAPGVVTAYWGPENRLGIPQPALTTNMGANSNLNGIQFTHDALAPVGRSVSFVEPITKTVIPIPALPALRIPPLALSPTPVRRTTLARDAAQDTPAQAVLAALSTATSAPDSVTAEGEVDAVRYGHVLKARRLVGVRGVGATYDGFYFVRRVSHTIADGRYTMAFTLSREGTGTLTPAVLP